jgi:hypothetical protein
LRQPKDSECRRVRGGKGERGRREKESVYVCVFVCVCVCEREREREKGATTSLCAVHASGQCRCDRLQQLQQQQHHHHHSQGELGKRNFTFLAISEASLPDIYCYFLKFDRSWATVK